MKKTIIAMLSIVLVIACVFGIVACKDTVDKTNPLSTFSYEIKRYYEDDFTLPSTVGDYDLEWASDNEAITLTKREENWLATVKRPETGTVQVKLTVTSNGYSKEYTTTVAAIEVSDILVDYNFSKNKAVVTKDFALDSEHTYKGKTATITWSVEDTASQEYIAISEDGKTCQVTPSTLKPEVKIKGTFTYGEEVASREYTMTVYVEMEPLQLVDYWYNNTGVSIDLSGYLVSIGINYDADYSNVTLYMVNDDLTAGYYLFRVKCTSDVAAKLVPGVHITATGTTNTNYNGLIETNAGGKLVVDEDIDPIDLSQTVRPIDDLIIGGLPETVYNESRLVSLSNWTVKKVADATKFDDTKTFTVLTLTKGGKDVTIAVSSKYLEGAYKPHDDVYEELCKLGETYKENDVVSVTGIMSVYSGTWQILPLNASAVTAGVADAEGTVYNGALAGAALNVVNSTLQTAGATTTIREDKMFTIPSTSGDVSIVAELCGFSRAVVVENNVVTVTAGKKDLATLKITYTVNGFTSTQFVAIESEAGEVVEPEEKFVKADAPFEEGKGYYLAVNQNNKNKTLYAINEMSGDYLKTTDNMDEASKIYVEKVENNYRLYFQSGDVKSYISYRVGQNKNGVDTAYICLVADQATAQVWAWDSATNCFCADLVLGEKTEAHYFGTYGDFETISISKKSYVSTSFPAYLGEMKKVEGGDEPDPTPEITEHAGTEADPFSVADVLALLDTLEKGATYSLNGNDTFYIKGYVITGTYNTQYKNFDDFTIGDTANAETTVVCFRPKMAEGVTQAEVGNLVVLQGKLQWYQSSSSDSNSKQVAQGALIVKIETGEDPDPTPEHTCAHVCPLCGKCTDASCADEACADKCEGHEPVVVTAAQAVELPDETPVIVTGVVTQINDKWNEKYSNITVTITDAEGNDLYVYRLATLVGIGDTITVTGKVGSYNGSKQIAAGATATIDVAHVCTEWTEANCTSAGKCVLCGKENADMPALGHVDADEDGVCDVCSANLNVSYESVTLTTYATEGTMSEDGKSLSWSNDDFTVTNNQNKSTTAIRTQDADHFRCYKNSELVISATGDKKIARVVIIATGEEKYQAPFSTDCTTEGVTVTREGDVFTITIDDGSTVDALTFVFSSNQARLTSVEIYYEA